MQEEAPQTSLQEGVVAGSLWLGCQWLVERIGATTQVIGEAGMRWRLTADRWAGCILVRAVTATMRLVWLVVRAKIVWSISVWVFGASEEGTAKRHAGMHLPLIPSSHLQGLVDLHRTCPPSFSHRRIYYLVIMRVTHYPSKMSSATSRQSIGSARISTFAFWSGFLF